MYPFSVNDTWENLEQMNNFWTTCNVYCYILFNNIFDIVNSDTTQT